MFTCGHFCMPSSMKSAGSCVPECRCDYGLKTAGALHLSDDCRLPLLCRNIVFTLHPDGTKSMVTPHTKLPLPRRYHAYSKSGLKKI